MSELSDDEFLSCFVSQLRLIRREVSASSGEASLRKALAERLFEPLLGWTRVEGWGHYSLSENRRIVFYDNEFYPVIVAEVERPGHALTPDHERRLLGRLKEGGVNLGVLTNLRRLVLYKRNVRAGLEKVADIDVERAVQKEAPGLTLEERKGMLKVRRLERRRFEKLEDVTKYC